MEKRNDIIQILTRLVLDLICEEQGWTVRLYREFNKENVLNAIKSLGGTEQLVKDIEQIEKEIEEKKEYDDLWDKVYNIKTSLIINQMNDTKEELISLITKAFTSLMYNKREYLEIIPKYRLFTYWKDYTQLRVERTSHEGNFVKLNDLSIEELSTIAQALSKEIRSYDKVNVTDGICVRRQMDDQLFQRLYQ